MEPKQKDEEDFFEALAKGKHKVTGVDALRKRMREIGATNVQAKSQIVDWVLAALANDDDIPSAEAIGELKKALVERENRVTSRENRVLAKEQSFLAKMRFEEGELKSSMMRLTSDLEAAKAELNKINEEIAARKKDLADFETQEARDRYRLLQIYKESVIDPDRMNGYERTAHIRAVGAILSGAGPEREKHD